MLIKEMTIKVSYSETNEGYMYDIWPEDMTNDEAEETDNGGLCTGNMRDALDMALTQALSMIPSCLEPKRKIECTFCGWKGKCKYAEHDEQGALCLGCGRGEKLKEVV